MEDPAGPRNLDEDRIDDALLQLQSIERSLLELSQHTLQPQVTIYSFNLNHLLHL